MHLHQSSICGVCRSSKDIEPPMDQLSLDKRHTSSNGRHSVDYANGDHDDHQRPQQRRSRSGREPAEEEQVENGSRSRRSSQRQEEELQYGDRRGSWRDRYSSRGDEEARGGRSRHDRDKDRSQEAEEYDERRHSSRRDHAHREHVSKRDRCCFATLLSMFLFVNRFFCLNDCLPYWHPSCGRCRL